MIAGIAIIAKIAVIAGIKKHAHRRKGGRGGMRAEDGQLGGNYSEYCDGVNAAGILRPEEGLRMTGVDLWLRCETSVAVVKPSIASAFRARIR
jgi:hypothetical protein